MTGATDGVDAAVKDRAMDAAPVGIVIADPHQDDNPLVYVNDTFEAITGHPADEIIGRNCRFLQGEGTDPAAVAAMREAIAAEEPVTVEVLNYRRDGEAFWNEVTIAPVYEDDELAHFVGFQSDVTDRKEAQLALAARTEELEHVLQRLNGLLYDITEALMHAQSREATEQVICDRLVATERYSAAWVGEVDPVDSSVEATTTAGAVGSLAAPIEEPGASLLREALEEETVVTTTEATDQLVGDPDMAAVAISPLIYRRQRYGVLVVGASEPDAFDGPEGAVLEVIGRTISTAIHAASTRQSVTDASRVFATVTITDPSFPLVALAQALEGTITYEDAVQRRDGSAALFLTTDTSMAAIERAVDEVDGLSSPSVVTDFDGHRLVELEEAAPSAVGWFAQLGAAIASLTLDDGRATLELALTPAIDGREVIEAIEERYVGTDLVAYRSLERPPATAGDFVGRLEEELTDRQHLVLKRAYLSGFYESRRAVTGDELADAMGISRSTFHQHRRAAERKLIEAFFSPTATEDD